MDNGQIPGQADQQRPVALNFTTAGYIKLVELANYYGIPLENVDDVLLQGLKVLELIKDSGSDNFAVMSNGQSRTINIREI